MTTMDKQHLMTSIMPYGAQYLMHEELQPASALGPNQYNSPNHDCLKCVPMSSKPDPPSSGLPNPDPVELTLSVEPTPDGESSGNVTLHATVPTAVVVILVVVITKSLIF